MPSHTHSITDVGHSHSYNTYTGSVLSTETVVGTNVADDNTSSQTTALSTTGITVNATGDGQSHNNMQPTLFLGNVFIFSGNFFDE
jgi:microcystin-dependent protein